MLPFPTFRARRLCFCIRKLSFYARKHSLCVQKLCFYHLKAKLLQCKSIAIAPLKHSFSRPFPYFLQPFLCTK